MGIVDGFWTVLQGYPLLFVFVGTLAGIVFGAIPGLSGSMLIVLLLPASYFMDPTHAIVLFIGIYVGTISGGQITSILLRMPGAPASVMTTLDGYPMAQKGHAARALGLGIAASFAGGTLSWIALATLAEPAARYAARITPFDLFALVVMAMVLIAAVSQGNLLRGIIAGLLGMLLSMPGVDPSVGMPRLTFGYGELNSGLNVVPVLVGLFVVGQMLEDILRLRESPETVRIEKGRGLVISLSDWLRHGPNILRSSVLGTWIGVLPAIGANVGSIVAYAAARSFSRTPEKFGQGAEAGIVASEAGNNSTIGGALIPLIALGVPGSIIDVLLISALMIHNIQPGPLLFRTNPDLTYAMIAAVMVANVIMFVTMLALVRPFSRLMYVPKSILLPIIFVFSVVGCYAVNNNPFDVWVMLAFGLLGFLLTRAGFPLAPFIIGFILAPIAESNLRTGLMISNGRWTPLYTEPTTLGILLASAAVLFWPMARARWRRAAPQ